jgi:hypothetical protein
LIFSLLLDAIANFLLPDQQKKRETQLKKKTRFSDEFSPLKNRANKLGMFGVCIGLSIDTKEVRNDVFLRAEKKTRRD